MLYRRIALICVFILSISFATVSGVFFAHEFVAPFNPALTEDGEVITGDKFVGGRINILVMGLDEGGTRSDTILLVSFEVKTKKITILSIPRDTRVWLGYYEKINAAVGQKGKEQSAMKAVKNLTGLPIHYYVSMNFKGFREVVDILGGVYIDVPRDMKYSDPYQKLYIDLKKGYQLLDGDKSEQFVRYRAGYSEGDIGRVHAQQIFVKEFIKQKVTLQNIANAPELYEKAKQHVNTNYSMSDLVSQVDLLKNADLNNIVQLDLPGTPRYINEISYWVCDDAKTKEMVEQYFSVE